MTRKPYWQNFDTVSHELKQQIDKIDFVLASMAAQTAEAHHQRLKRTNLVRTIQSNLEMDGIRLNAPEVTVILNGKAPKVDTHKVQAVQNALKGYELSQSLDPLDEEAFLKAYCTFMGKCVQGPISYRETNLLLKTSVPIVHQIPPTKEVPKQMAMLFDYLKHDKTHALIKAIVFQFQISAIQPFDDGNGRIARFWRSLILQSWQPYFVYLPIDSVCAKQVKTIDKQLEHCLLNQKITPYVSFILELILEAISYFAPLIARHVQIPKPQSLSLEVSSLLRLMTQEYDCKELSILLNYDDIELFYRECVAPAMAKSFVTLSNPNETELAKRKLVLTELGYEWQFINMR